MFYNRLKEEVKDNLICVKTSSFIEYAKEAVTINNRQYKQQYKQYNRKPIKNF